jgi:hypothetical protein
MADADTVGGHAFISYVREDADRADELHELLQAAGVAVWRDTDDLLPGEDWQMVIRRAISKDSLVFLACFSQESASRDKTFQNEELVLAVEQLRRRPPDEPWLIPVRFDDCQIPDRDIGAGRTLASIQRADLFGSRRDKEAARLVAAVQRILGSRDGLKGSRRRGAAVPENEPLKAQDVESLHPREVARRLKQMQPAAAVLVLARAPAAASAEVLDVLLGENEALTVRILAHAHESKTRALIAAMTSPEWLQELPAAADAIDRCERNLRALLGEATDELSHAGPSRAGTHGYRRDFENGQIHWSRRGGAAATAGLIGERYRELGGAADGPLGFPLTGEGDAEPCTESGTTGRFQRFEASSGHQRDTRDDAGAAFGATIYWSPKNGAHPTWGSIGELHEAQGGTGRWLGFPRSGEIQTGPSKRDDGNGTTGVYQKFEGGSMYYSDKTGAIAVPAPIDGHLRYQHKGATSPLGFPVSPLMPAGPSPYGAEGQYQRFEGKWDYPEDILRYWTERESPGGATIYTSQAHGTHCVGWGNGILYERLAGTTSWLGFPTSDSSAHRSASGEYHLQEFEGGVIIWSKAQGSVAVPKATIEHMNQQAGLRDYLGLPLKRPGKSAGEEPFQFFENGVITRRDGATEAWIPASTLRGPDPQDVDLLKLDCSAETAIPGQTITLEYAIQSRLDHPVLVVLGATLVAANRDEYFDEATDRHVNLTPGEATYRRRFQVPPDTPEGSYRLTGAAWYPSSGSQVLARIDCPFPVAVHSP